MVSGVEPVVGLVVDVVFILEVVPQFTFIVCTDYEAPTSNFKEDCMPAPAARRSFVVVYERSDYVGGL